MNEDLLRQLERGLEIEALPDGERYGARQRWLNESVELLLKCVLAMRGSVSTDDEIFR
jgi:hypothetical protein